MLHTVTIDAIDYSIYAEPVLASTLKLRYDVNWATETDEDRKIALVFARQFLDTFPYKGTRTPDAEVAGTQFPRTGIVNVADDEIPAALAISNVLLAQRAVVSDSFASTGAKEIKLAKIGPKTTEYFSTAQGDLLARRLGGSDILRLLRALLIVPPVSGNAVIGNDGTSLFEAPSAFERTIGIA